MSKRNPIEITFYFNTIEEVIATLGSLVQKAAPVATLEDPAKPLVIEKPVVKPRKPRADAGKPRGPYNKVEAPAVASSLSSVASQGAIPEGAPDAAASTPETAAPAAEPVAPAPVTPEPAASSTAGAEAIPSDAEIVAALERVVSGKSAGDALALLAEFGVKRGRDLKPEQRADFIKKADEVANG